MKLPLISTVLGGPVVVFGAEEVVPAGVAVVGTTDEMVVTSGEVVAFITVDFVVVPIDVEVG